MKNFHDLITQRKSIRKYSDRKLTPEQVELLFQAALKSPSSKNKKPWQFIAIEDKETLEALANCKRAGSKPIAGCALAIVVVADPLTSDVWIEDASIASLMIQLQAEDLGLGSCWIQIRERYTVAGTQSDDFIRELLNIPLQLQILSVITIGNKIADTTDKNPIEKELEWEKIHIGKYE